MSDLDPQPGHLRLYRGRSLHTSTPEYDDASRAVHMDAAGAYLTRDKFLVLSRELLVDPINQPGETIRVPVEPLKNATAGATPGGGSPFAGGAHSMGQVIEVEWGDGTFMAITTTGIWRRDTGDDWTQVYNEGTPGRLPFRRITYANGIWLVAQGGNDSNAGYILRSADEGENWTEAQLSTVGRIDSVTRGFGGEWLATIYRRLSSTSTEALGIRSSDNGETWGAPGAIGAGAVLPDAVLINERELFIPAEFPASGYGLGDAHIYNSQTGSGVAYWGWAAVAPVGSERDAWKVLQRAKRVVHTNNNHLVIISIDGRVTRSNGPVTTEPGLFQKGRVEEMLAKISGVSSEPGGSVTVNDLGLDKVTNTIIAVGGFAPTGGGASQARAWRSTDDGLTWSRMEEIEDAMQTPIVSVAMDDQGNALYMNSARWAFSGTRRGLEGGEYNVYVVSYFNTHAGKFVYDMQMQTLTTEDGGSISFSAPTKAEILDANSPAAGGWITEEYEPILDDLRFDVYIQAVREPIAGEDVAYTIRYAFTEPFPEAGGSVNRTLEELPLGRQFVNFGLPTTAVWEKRHTALHNGRVWGMAAQDESRWSMPHDTASPEIANQHQRFVLSYSEIGWANLISDRSWIVIQPTQSTRFTGILSTPSGLLVMFENEIHLVTGDPAFGNVSVELYLDMVGNDPPLNDGDLGPQPCKVGGVPFVIWNGKVWVLQAGQAQQVGQEQWLRSDPFKRISPEPQTRSLLALTESGLVFRYMLDDQFWLTDPVTRADTPVLELLTNCACESGDNTRFMAAAEVDNEEFHGLWSTRTDGTPDSPHVYYRDLDFGALDSRSALYLVKVGLEGAVLALEYDRNDPSFDANLLPALFYAAANEANGLLEVVDPLAAGGIIPYIRQNNRLSNTIAWRLPLARTRGSSIDVRLELRGFDYDDVLKMPLQLFFARGGVVR